MVEENYECEALQTLRGMARDKVLEDRFHWSYAFDVVSSKQVSAHLVDSRGKVRQRDFGRIWCSDGFTYLETYSDGVHRFGLRHTDAITSTLFLAQHTWGLYLEEKYKLGRNPCEPYEWSVPQAAHDLVSWWDEEVRAWREEYDAMCEEHEGPFSLDELPLSPDEPDWWSLLEAVSQEALFAEMLFDHDPYIFEGGFDWGRAVARPLARALHVPREFFRQRNQLI